MELVEENQKAPLAFVVIFTICIIAASEVLVRITTSGQAAQVNKYYWLMDRAAGMTAYELIALGSILGVSMTSGIWDRKGLRKWAKQLHQYTTLLFIPFVVLHLYGLYQDTSIPFTLGSLLVPFTSHFNPLLTALGVLSLYAVLLLIVTSYIRDKISVKVWRQVHFLSFPMFVAVTLHGLLIGTDTHTSAGFLPYAIPLCLFIGLTVNRIVKGISPKSASPGRA